MQKDEKKKVKVTHIMANGEVRDSLVGYKLDMQKFPEVALRLILQIARGEK